MWKNVQRSIETLQILGWGDLAMWPASPQKMAVLRKFIGFALGAMKAPNYKIEFDAQEAFKILGVDLRISPLAEKCVESLRRRLERLITTDLLVDALGDAAHAGKSRRGPKKSGATGEPKKEGRADEV
jgi:hypothetical protein